MLLEDASAFAQIVCQDIDHEDGVKMLESLAKHSAQSFRDPLTYAGYQTIPSSYLLCELDLAGPPWFQESMIAMMETAASGRKVGVTRLAASHFANVSRPKEVARWIIDIVDRL